MAATTQKTFNVHLFKNVGDQERHTAKNAFGEELNGIRDQVTNIWTQQRLQRYQSNGDFGQEYNFHMLQVNYASIFDGTDVKGNSFHCLVDAWGSVKSFEQCINQTESEYKLLRSLTKGSEETRLLRAGYFAEMAYYVEQLDVLLMGVKEKKVAHEKLELFSYCFTESEKKDLVQSVSEVVAKVNTKELIVCLKP